MHTHACGMDACMYACMCVNVRMRASMTNPIDDEKSNCRSDPFTSVNSGIKPNNGFLWTIGSDLCKWLCNGGDKGNYVVWSCNNGDKGCGHAVVIIIGVFM